MLHKKTPISVRLVKLKQYWVYLVPWWVTTLEQQKIAEKKYIPENNNSPLDMPKRRALLGKARKLVYKGFGVC